MARSVEAIDRLFQEERVIEATVTTPRPENNLVYVPFPVYHQSPFQAAPKSQPNALLNFAIFFVIGTCVVPPLALMVLSIWR